MVPFGLIQRRFRVDMTIGTMWAVSTDSRGPFCGCAENKSPSIWGLY